MKDRKWSRNLSEVRAVSSNFGIMEQQSGANGWNTRMEAPTPRPGQITLWNMQRIMADWDGVQVETASYLFVLNYLAQPASLVLKRQLKNLWTGKDEAGEVELEGYGAKVYAL